MKVVVFTRGPDGSQIIFKDGTKFCHPGYTVSTVDTTGAGDAFIGAVIRKLTESEYSAYSTLAESGWEVLRFANAVGAMTTMRKGAISSIPARHKVETFIGGL